MTKIKLLLSVVFTISLLCIGCNTDEPSIETIDNTTSINTRCDANTFFTDSLECLMNELEEANQAVLSIYGEPETRARSKQDSRKKIYETDGVGTAMGFVWGLLGAVIVGASASFCCWLGLNVIFNFNTDLPSHVQRYTEKAYFYSLTQPQNTDTLSSRLHIPEDYKDECCMVGFKHNEVLDNMLNKRNIISNFSVCNYDTTLFHTASYQNIVYPLWNNIIEDNELYDNSTTEGKIIYSYHSALELLQDTEPAIQSLSNRYYSIINGKSFLTDEEKKYLFTVFTVTYYSFNFWQKQLENEN